ncbi:MAG TPA: L,D-transpeptidase family protein [bacterium]|nr:L,D-transpeptidase family protein [bacterium]HOG38376.1 L,D-transpeptidase family protein [bacterium]HQI03334.1 L,D-transpeptidase family protein [bacterium]
MKKDVLQKSTILVLFFCLSFSLFANNNETSNTEQYSDERLKEDLRSLAYYNEKETNIEKLNLRNALIRFQADNNLRVDGVCGPITIETILKRLNSKDFQYSDEIKNPATKDKWIVLNLSKRILTLYQECKVLKKYPIAIGAHGSPTPEGKFSVVDKLINPWWGGGGYAKPIAGGKKNNPLGYRWIGLSYGGGYRYGIHGNSSPYSIGKNISHGCVRMINGDVEELFSLIEKDVPVWIGKDDTLMNWGIKQE